jgi:hypothetical protein
LSAQYEISVFSLVFIGLSFVPWYKKPKSLKNNFFRAYANTKLASNYLTSIVGINKIIPAIAYAGKNYFLSFLAFCTMVQNLNQ